MYGVDFVFEEFPRAKKYFKSIGVKQSGVMAASLGGTISFNDRYFQLENPTARKEMTVDTGFHPKNNTLFSTGAHEAGHILEAALVHANSQIPILDWNNSTYANRIVSEACRNAKKITKQNYGTMKENISRYACKNNGECLAESVADYVANRENAQVLSKEIWKILKRELG